MYKGVPALENSINNLIKEPECFNRIDTHHYKINENLLIFNFTPLSF